MGYDRDRLAAPTSGKSGQAALSKGITASALKWTAAVLMLINHCCISCFDYIYTGDSWLNPFHWYISRPSFIIFAFLISEGMAYTRNRGKYMLRLLIFSLVSELPYNLCFHHELIYFGSLNVGFTMLIGAVAIEAGERLPLWWEKVIGVLLAALTASVLGASYGAFGVILIVCFYVLRDSKWRYPVAAAVIVLVYAADLQMDFVLKGYTESFLPAYRDWAQYAVKMEAHGILALPLFALYKGERGNGSKWFFYIFYPAHLLIIYIVTIALTGA